MLYLGSIYRNIEEVRIMISYDTTAYSVMLGSINENIFSSSATCISQCTGCMCNCRCSCSGGIISDFEWEVI